MLICQKALCEEFKALHQEAANEVKTANDDRLALVREYKMKISSINKKLH